MQQRFDKGRQHRPMVDPGPPMAFLVGMPEVEMLPGKKAGMSRLEAIDVAAEALEYLLNFDYDDFTPETLERFEEADRILNLPRGKRR